MPTQYIASEFADRDALEVAISDKTTEPKTSTITGTVEELATLRLEHGMVVWGVAVVASDYEAPVKHAKPQRGELHVFGINVNKRDDENN
jgi:hypothetical protein